MSSPHISRESPESVLNQKAAAGVQKTELIPSLRNRDYFCCSEVLTSRRSCESNVLSAICKTDYWAKAYTEGKTQMFTWRKQSRSHWYVCDRVQVSYSPCHNKPLHPEPIAQCHNTIKRDKSFSYQLISASAHK